MLALSALLLGTFVQGALSKCDCVATPSTPNQEKAESKPDIPADYGYSCKAHDVTVGDCVGKLDTAFGQPNDYCLQKWCIVTKDCDFKTRPVSYSKAEDDVFSFEACDDDGSFKGNAWIGYCKNCFGGTEPDLHKSFCTCGGEATCPCVRGSDKQTKSDGSPDYVEEAESFAYGCMPHDMGKGQCKDADTSAGSALDWCGDSWCNVDPEKCATKTRPTAYTENPKDFFSYETCDKSFAGNAWVGTCRCTDYLGSFCTCPDSTTDDGTSGGGMGGGGMGGGMGGGEEVANDAHTLGVGGVLALVAAMVQ